MNNQHLTPGNRFGVFLRGVAIALGVQLAVLVITGTIAILSCDALGVGPRSQLSLRFLGNVVVAAPVLALLYGLLFLTVLALAVPVLGTVWAFRRHVPLGIARVLVAVSTAVGAEWILYRMEWFDVWRWGIPPVRHWATVVVPWAVSYFAAGFLIGGALIRSCEPISQGPRRHSL